jgi:hypothetical protein
MEYTIKFTPQSICNHINNLFDKDFTVEQIEDNWDGITNYIENWITSGLMGENLWEDFDAFAEEWEINLF